MKEMTLSEFRRLLSHREPWSVSILMPAHTAGPEIRQDPIRLKNLLNRAQEQLKEVSGNRADGRLRIDPIRPLVEDMGFWRGQSDGLAFFSKKGEYSMYRLPVPLEEAVVVDERFHLKPMVPIATEDENFYILALSQNNVRFFRGSRYSLVETELKGAPKSFEEAERFTEDERYLQFHTVSAERPNTGDRASVFHGHGGGVEQERKKKRVYEFCNLVDAAVNKRLAKLNTPPLILLGTEPIASIYREASEYKGLDAFVIHGTPDLVDTRQAHAEAVKALEDYFKRERQETTGQFHVGMKQGMASLDFNKIADAVAMKRVDRLFVALGENVWCKWNPDTKKNEIHESQEPGDHDLLNRLALEVYDAGGKVFAAPREELPGEAIMAATYRFPVDK